MIKTALKNLKLLNFGTDDYQDKYLIPEGIKLSLISKDNFDPIHNLQLLEYPIYFTYNHVLNEISDNYTLAYKQRKYLLELIEGSLDNLCELINNHDHDDEKNNVNHIIHGIDNRLDIVKEKTIITRCEFMFIFFDDLIDAFHEVSKYLHITPVTPDEEDEEEGDENEDEEDEEDEEDDKEEEECEEEAIEEETQDNNTNINKLD